MLGTIRGVIADMDGVLWRGDEPLHGAVDFFRWLPIPYAFATNNSTRTAQDYCQKLARMGIPATPEQVITSSVATAAYLAEQYPAGTTAYVVGETGLQEALQAVGFTLIEDQQPALVVAGLDRTLTYQKIATASHYIRCGAAFIGTNGDLTFPLPDRFAPGAGSVLAAIQAGSGVAPQIIGKPERPMFEIALRQLGTAPHETLMIGDRLETDIWGAGAIGMQTALVLSGISTENDIIRSEIKPDIVQENLAALLETMRRIFL